MNHKLQRTKAYSQFSLAKENRPLELINLKSQHKKLRQSMQKHGFLPSFPITVKAVNGKFVIQDGQHRFTFAREFGLEVYFVVIEEDIDIAEINQAQAAWSLRDYANRWANAGHKNYAIAMSLAAKYEVPIGMAFAMLAGTITFNNIVEQFHSGDFAISPDNIAERVASCYSQLHKMKRGMKHQNLLTAIYACCHVPYFEESRIINTVSRRPEMLTSCGTREGFLQMLGEIYNHCAKVRQPLAFDAAEAMRARAGNTAAIRSKPSKLAA